MYRKLRGNMQRIAERCGDNYELYNMVTRKALAPVVDKHDQLEGRLQHHQQGTDEEILEYFADVGTPRDGDQVPGQMDISQIPGVTGE